MASISAGCCKSPHQHCSAMGPAHAWKALSTQLMAPRRMKPSQQHASPCSLVQETWNEHAVGLTGKHYPTPHTQPAGIWRANAHEESSKEHRLAIFPLRRLSHQGTQAGRVAGKAGGASRWVVKLYAAPPKPSPRVSLSSATKKNAI